MLKAVIYKEWIKTRWYLLGILLVIAVMAGYQFLNLSKSIEFYGKSVIWSTMLSRDTVLVDGLKYLPLLAGGLLAVVQFIPEIIRKRLKLTLHLPYPRKKMIFSMYGYGICALVVLCGLMALAVGIFFSGVVSRELVSRVLMTMVPWFLCGLAAYIWVVAACAEPTWKGRVLVLLLLAGLVRLLFMSSVPESYNGMIWILLLYVLCGQLIIYHSVARFKEGLQD